MNEKNEVRREEARARRAVIRATPKGPKKQLMKKINQQISQIDYLQDKAKQLEEKYGSSAKLD